MPHRREFHERPEPGLEMIRKASGSRVQEAVGANRPNARPIAQEFPDRERRAVVALKIPRPGFGSDRRPTIVEKRRPSRTVEA